MHYHTRNENEDVFTKKHKIMLIIDIYNILNFYTEADPTPIRMDDNTRFTTLS